jgi:hypothetical protein
MKNRLFVLFLFITAWSYSQIDIKGAVYNNSEPFQDVAVYLNNTMLGTTTNGDGEFLIPVKDGVYKLIIS